MDNRSTNKFIDISSELWRSYTFPGGDVVKIDVPTHLSAGPGGHRVLDALGVSHYIPKGWIHLQWKPVEGGPNFVK